MPDSGPRTCDLERAEKALLGPIIDEVWGELTSEKILARCVAGAPSTYFLRRPTLRRLYLLAFVMFTLFVLVPLWTLLYLPPRNRPRPSWTLKRALRVRWKRRLCAVVARCEIDHLGNAYSSPRDPLLLQHSHPVTIAPAPDSWLLGYADTALKEMLSTRGRWHPTMISKRTDWGKWNPPPEQEYGFAPVPAYWYTGKKASPEALPPARLPGQPLVLHFHGGGYVLGSAGESDLVATISKNIVEYTPVTHVLSIDYRLAGTSPWPLPLLDAISAYHHLVFAEQVEERDILLCGDSAGGHLALALTRWLHENGKTLGLTGPRAILLSSPWCDTGFTHAWGDKALNRNADSDIIDASFGPFASSLLTRALPVSWLHSDPYLSPASLLIPAAATGPDSFEGFPPCFVLYGEAERLTAEINELWRRLRLSRDAPDVLLAVPNAVHDFIIFDWFAEETAGVYEQMDEWIRKLFGADDSDDEVPDADVPLISPILSARSPYLAPLSPFMRSPDLLPLSAIDLPSLASLSPDLAAFSPEVQLARRRSRRESRAALRIGKSPRLPAQTKRDNPRLMYTDMREEGSRLIDLPPLDLGASVVGAAKEIMTPFTAQFEKGEWDWGGEWYGVDGDDDEDEEEYEEDEQRDKDKGKGKQKEEPRKTR